MKRFFHFTIRGSSKHQKPGKVEKKAVSSVMLFKCTYATISLKTVGSLNACRSFDMTDPPSALVMKKWYFAKQTTSRWTNKL